MKPEELRIAGRVPRVVHLTTVHHVHDPRIFRKEVGSLRKVGWEVYLVAPHTRDETVEGVPIIALPKPKKRRGRIGLQGKAFRAARALKADLYHFHDPELIPVAYALKRTTSARIIYDMHEDYGGRSGAEGRLLRSLEQWCFRWVDHVVLAEEGYAPIMAKARVPHTPILNYFLPMTEAAPQPHPAPEGGLALLYAGVQGEARGLTVLLDVAERIRAEGLPWHVHLAGICFAAAERTRAEACIEAEHLGDIVQRAGWTDYLPWADMEPFYRTADVGLALLHPHPNYLHSLPTKFYEYLHYGLPILCSDFPLWRTFIEQHGCGAVVDPKDPEAILRVLKSWSDDPARYTRLAAAAATAAPAFHWSHMETHLLNLYMRLLK